MASFNGDIGTPAGGFNLKVEYSISQSVEGNYSDITATGYVKRNKSSYYPYNSQSSASLIIDGESATYGGAYNLGSDGYKTILSKSKRVYHNGDGTKTINISFSFNGLLSNWYPNGSISQTVILPTIPRASDIGCSSPYIGDMGTITINKKASNFTSTVWYVFGNVSNTIATKTSASVISFNTNSVKAQLYAQIPNAKSGVGTMYCQTFNGNTSVGTKSCSFSLYAKESECKPDVSATIKDILVPAINQTGDENVIIRACSHEQVTVNATAKYSSSIKSYSVTCADGEKDTRQVSIIYRPKSPITKVTATDSRGYSTTVEYDLSKLNKWLDYVELAFVGDVSITRPEETSNEAILNVKGNYFNGSFGKTAGLRNIKVGDDLSGKKIYCTFDENLFTYIMKQYFTKNVIVADKSIIQQYVSSDDESYVKADNVSLFDAQQISEATSSYINTKVSLSEYTLPDDFGVVTSIDEDAISYESIYILSDDTPVDNNNTLEMSYYYKKTTDTYWSQEIPLNPTISDDNTFYINNLSLGNDFDYEEEYQFLIYANDKLMWIGGYQNEVTLTKGKPVVSIGDGTVWVYGDLLLNDISLIDTYSTEEVKTNKVWIDGKPIYRKVVYTSNVSQTTTLNPNISNLGTFTEVTGKAKRRNSYTNNLPCNYTNWEIYMYDFAADRTVVKFSDNQWNAGVEYIFVTYEYTKLYD